MKIGTLMLSILLLASPIMARQRGTKPAPAAAGKTAAAPSPPALKTHKSTRSQTHRCGPGCRVAPPPGEWGAELMFP